MRCKNCPFCYFDYSENGYYCKFEIYEENAKGETGCKYNLKTLKKMEKEQEEEILKGNKNANANKF